MKVWEQIARDAAASIDYDANYDYRDGFYEVILEAIKKGAEQLVRMGLGECPIKESDFKDWTKRVERNISLNDRGIFNLIMLHYNSRIAFLASDNEAYADGYRQGIAEGKRRCVSTIDDFADGSYLEEVTKVVKEVSIEV